MEYYHLVSYLKSDEFLNKKFICFERQSHTFQLHLVIFQKDELTDEK